MIVLRRELFGLIPTDEAGAAFLRTVKIGECIAVDAKRPRNLQQHRLFWALMQKVYENQEHYKSADEVCTAFKFAVGHVDTLRTKRGDVQVPKSISFAKMPQDEFDAFFKRAVDFCVTEVIPGLPSDALEAEVLEMIK